MKQYFRNEIIIKKNTQINQVFKIVKGHIINAKQTRIYKPNDYLFIEQIFYNPKTLDDYIALDLVAGEWINKDEIKNDFYIILSKMYQQEKNHNELLSINDPLIKFSRYLYFEYQNKQITSFYLTMGIKDLATYLNISNLSEILHFLVNQKIITKHNKLFNILDIDKLEELAYRNDY